MGIALADVWFAFNVDPFADAITDEDSWIRVTDDVRVDGAGGTPVAYATAQWSGRFSTFAPGNATIVLDNRTRRYDPTHTDSPFAAWLERSVAVRITARDGGTRHTIWYGYVTHWGPKFTGTHDAVCVVTATDGLSILGRIPFANTVGGSGDQAGDVIGDILDTESGTGGPPTALRDLDAGVAIQSHTGAGTAASAIQTVVQSDGGWFYVDRDGVFTFRSRNAIADNTRMLTSQLTLDDSTEPTFRYTPALEMSGVGDDVVNTATITREGGTAQTASAASAGNDGIPIRHDRTIQAGSDAEADALANFIVDWYSAPASHPLAVSVRAGSKDRIISSLFNEAAFILDAGAGGIVSPDQTRAAVYGVRLMDRITITFTPGYGSEVSADCFVTGMSGTVTPDAHEVTLQLVSADQADDNLAAPPDEWLILDDATLGKLDTGKLGY